MKIFKSRSCSKETSDDLWPSTLQGKKAPSCQRNAVTIRIFFYTLGRWDDDEFSDVQEQMWRMTKMLLTFYKTAKRCFFHMFGMISRRWNISSECSGNRMISTVSLYYFYSKPKDSLQEMSTSPPLSIPNRKPSISCLVHLCVFFHWHILFVHFGDQQELWRPNLSKTHSLLLKR